MAGSDADDELMDDEDKPDVPAAPEPAPHPPAPDVEQSCGRCKEKFKSSKIVVRSHVKCCPHCFAPVSWKA